VSWTAHTAGQNVTTAQKLQKMSEAANIPNVRTAGNAEDAFDRKETNVVDEVVSIALPAVL